MAQPVSSAVRSFSSCCRPPTAPVVCLVRDSGREDPRHRLLNGLESAAAAYQLPSDLVRDNRHRIHVSVGDITGPVDAITLPGVPIGEVWHSAASLRYEDRHKAEIFTTNVGGTRTVIDLTRRSGAHTLNHISTAYVAGRMTGRIREEIHPGEHPTNNLYELSKIEGEGLVSAARERFRRPDPPAEHRHRAQQDLRGNQSHRDVRFHP